MKKISAIGFALLMVFAVFVPVVSALNDPTKEGYQSVVNPNPAGEKSPENIGHLDVLLACRSPQIGGEFTIVPVTVSAPFTNAARVDKAFVDQFVKQFGEPETKQYLPDGTFDGNFAPGTYLLKQIDGNGGQPEFALVTIKAADSQTVVFLGHGITPADEPKEHVPVIVITDATYGAFTTEVDEPAHYLHPEGHKHVTQAYQPEVAEQSHMDYEVGHKHAKPASGSAHDFYYNGQKYQYVQNNENEAAFHPCGYLFTHPAVKNVKVIDVAYQPEVPEVFHMDACTHFVGATYEQVGHFADVTAAVQSAVDQGYTSFKFRNDGANKGIVSTDDTVQIVTVPDPIVGKVKDVHIEYTVDGVAKTIDTQEYQIINLV